MTKEEYLKLRKEGEEEFMLIIRDLNHSSKYSYETAAKEGTPDYRTYGAWSEICVALALQKRKSVG